VMERADAEIAIGQGEAENERLLMVRWRDLKGNAKGRE